MKNGMDDVMDERGRRGIVFTFEALLGLLLLFALTALLPLLVRQDSNTLEKTIFLLDAFEVLEKGYHDELAEWTVSGPLPRKELSDAVDAIAAMKGQQFYVKSGEKTIPVDISCESDISIERIVITDTGWKKVTVALCKD